MCIWNFCILGILEKKKFHIYTFFFLIISEVEILALLVYWEKFFFLIEIYILFSLFNHLFHCKFSNCWFVNYNARGSYFSLSATAQSYLPSRITFKFYDYSCNSENARRNENFHLLRIIVIIITIIIIIIINKRKKEPPSKSSLY